MERINFGYSVKNIPTPNQRAYKAELIEKIEAVIKRMRWKALFFQPNDPNPNDESQNPQTYGLKTNKCPPQVPAMKKFEADLIKVILDKINSSLKDTLKVNQWKNTASVISWFKQLQEKPSHTFMMFDIKDFYLSISETLLKEALNFAKSKVRISKIDEDTIFHARKSLLFDGSHVWIKKKGGLFDVTMGAYDGAEVCELVGTYLLNKVTEKYPKEKIGLYRDDGLAAFLNTSGPQNERIKKDFQRIFKEKGLDIVIVCNRKSVDYLDITMNLTDGSYKPYHKPEDETSYIHKESDHPPNITRQLPTAVEKRISDLSSSEEIFEQSKQHYQEALKKSGYTHQLKYNPTIPSTSRRNRRNRGRKIIWFNPPYSRSVETNIGKEFLRLIDIHFPEHDPYTKYSTGTQ